MKGEDEEGLAYSVEGAKLEIRECLPEGTTCADLIAEVEKTPSEGGMEITYSDCKFVKM